MAIEITTPVGRLVQGHPMVRKPKKDRQGNVKLNDDGSQALEIFFAIAIAKGQETHWNQTEWGQKIHAQAQADWPNGEWQRQDFAWKIIDGDSPVPNKAGRIPNQREGFPGHWVVTTSTRFEGVRCFHAGKYAPYEVIQNKDEIKRGDYVRAVLSVKGNGPSESPGVYINPELFELTRAGVQIVSDDGPDAATAFGSAPVSLPAGAQLAPEQAAVQQALTPVQQTPTPVQPDPTFAAGAAGAAPPPPPPPAGPVMLPAAGGVTYEAYIAQGWTDALLIQHGYMQG